MKTRFLLLSTIALFSSSVEAWGKREPVSTHVDPHFPFSPQQEWFTEESYLLWKPYVRDMDFGRRESFDEPDFLTAFLTLKPKRPDFEWSSGVRIGIGKYLPHHDLWDIDVFMTYLNSDASRKVTPKEPDGVTQDFSVAFQGSNSSTGHWRLNYYAWDLTLGRLFNLPYSITLHPFVGLRGALFDQAYKVRHTGILVESFEVSTFTDHFKGTNDFWGVGPRAGTDFMFEFERHWALLGHFAGSILYGHYDVRESVDFRGRSVSSTFTVIFDQLIKAKDHEYVIRSNLEGSFGLGWEKWFNNHTVRVAPSILFEAGVWFAINQFYDLQLSPGISPNRFTVVEPNRRHGNLVYSGYTFNLQVDF